MSDKLSGKASSFLYNGVSIPIKKTTPKVTRKLADSTDSDDYDSATDLLYPTQIPVSAVVEMSIEGNYNKTKVPANLIAPLFTGDAAVTASLNLDSGTIFGSGKFDISDFSTDVPVEDVVTYSATLKSNGKFTPGA